MKVVFRVDASFLIEIGHVMPCRTLVEFLKNIVNVEFICRKNVGYLIEKIQSNASQISNKVSDGLDVNRV